jgi:beta-mannanase
VSASWAEGRLPMVTLEPIHKDTGAGQPTLRDIYTGKFDPFLTTWAQAAAAQNMTFVLRFAQEMNGNWYTWSDGQFGNARGDYVKAWRHVHDVFAANGADEVIWNWSPNRVDSLSDRTLGRFYPGDDYVDWAGVSGYLRSVGSTPPSFDTTFGQSLAELKRVAPSKLVVLTEVGAGTTEANRVAWINDLFAKLLQHPEIIGFNWFNDFKSGGDWRIGYSTQTEAAFRSGVADARYGPLVP